MPTPAWSMNPAYIQVELVGGMLDGDRKYLPDWCIQYQLSAPLPDSEVYVWVRTEKTTSDGYHIFQYQGKRKP